jgi:predicted metal-dependent peptidase
MNQEAATKITRARIAMIMRQPFFGTLAVRLVVKEDDTLVPKTLATDGKTMYYHPDWVIENDFELVCSGIAHEVGHCVLDHIGRRNGREPTRWNHAGDYVINAMLKDCGFTIGSDWLYAAGFANQSTDEVYAQLPPIPPGGGGQRGGQGQFDKHFDVLPSGIDPAMNTDDWQIAGVQAANAAKARGDLPASLKRFIDEITRVKADWRAVLRQFMTERARDDYSYARVNRKFAALGIFLPGLYSESMGEVAIAVDTSGSISREIFSAFMAEIDELRNQLQPTMMNLIQCDAEIGRVDSFEQYDDFTPSLIEATGGGGTDFCPPFEWVKKGANPKCFVYLTDGYGPFPPQPPYPVLWLMTTDVKPPFGEVVRIEV